MKIVIKDGGNDIAFKAEDDAEAVVLARVVKQALRDGLTVRRVAELLEAEGYGLDEESIAKLRALDRADPDLEPPKPLTR